MLSLALAQQLQVAGLVWTPASGDRFVVPRPQLDQEVFVVSDITVEVHDLPTGRVIGFNGTTEWALDSVKLPEVVWLPSEGQLRTLLGERFVRLEVVPEGFAVVLTADERHLDADPECAYGRALLHGLTAWTRQAG